MATAAVLLLGGTGLIGGGVSRRLATAGHDVTVGSRRATATEPGCRTVAVDLADVDSLRRAVVDVDVVVAVMPLSDGRRDGFVAERDGTRNLLAALAERPSVRIVKLSELGAGSDPSCFDLACKAESERAVMESGHPWWILRPSWVMEAWPHQLTSRVGVLVPVGYDQPIGWVSVNDLGRWAAAGLERWPEVSGLLLDAQGPERLTFRDAGRRYAEVIGARTIPLPVAVLGGAAPFSRRQRTLWELFRHSGRSDQSLRSDRLHELLGPPRVDFASFLQTAVRGHG